MKITIEAAPGYAAAPTTPAAVALLLETAARNVATFGTIPPGATVMAIRATDGVLLGSMTIAPSEAKP